MVAGGIISPGLQKKVYGEKKKKNREQRNQSVFKEKSARILEPAVWLSAPHIAAPETLPACAPPSSTAPDGRRWGCGLLWPCASACLRCSVSRARLVLQCAEPAGTERHRWVPVSALLSRRSFLLLFWCGMNPPPCGNLHLYNSFAADIPNST